MGILYWLYKKYFEALLVLCGWDLFAIYREGRTKYRFPLIPEFRVGRNGLDKWRERLRIPILCLICYLGVRLTIFGLVKVADAVLLDVYVFNSTHIQSLSDSSRDQLDAFLSPSLGRYIMPDYYQTTIKQVMKLGDSVKEPFDSMSTTTNLLELIITVPLFFFYFLVPLTHQRTPLNASIQRFMLEPSREINRIDSAIKRQLDSLLHESSGSQAVRGQLAQVASLRPPVYSLK